MQFFVKAAVSTATLGALSILLKMATVGNRRAEDVTRWAIEVADEAAALSAAATSDAPPLSRLRSLIASETLLKLSRRYCTESSLELHLGMDVEDQLRKLRRAIRRIEKSLSESPPPGHAEQNS